MSSWESRPTTVIRPAYFWDSSCSAGASVLQGSHQDAQKFSTTGLPRSDESVVVPCPFTFWSVKFGAIGWPPSATSAAIEVWLSITLFANSPISAASRITAPAWSTRRIGTDTRAGYPPALTRCGGEAHVRPAAASSFSLRQIRPGTSG